MTLDEFQDSVRHDGPAKGLSFELTALWWDSKGDWTKAHESAQQDEGPARAWVHAYLHRRKETPRTPRIGARGRARVPHESH